MAMTIFWTDFAKAALKDIFVYHKDKAGARASLKLVEEVVKSTEVLVRHPLLGAKEELLSDRIEDFRYLIFRNYKVIYWLNQKYSRVEIIDVFDTRQNPLLLKKHR